MTFSTAPQFATSSGRTRLDPRLLDIMHTAASSYGLDVQAFSGVAGRSTGTTNHPGGYAIDIKLVDPSTGKVLPDYQNASSFPAYEKFAQTARVIQQQKYPELDNTFRWGGYFAGGPNPEDLMHFDINPTLNGAMGAGSWNTGLSPTYAKTWGITGANPGLATPAGQQLVASIQGGPTTALGAINTAAAPLPAPAPLTAPSLAYQGPSGAPTPMPGRPPSLSAPQLPTGPLWANGKPSQSEVDAMYGGIFPSQSAPTDVASIYAGILPPSAPPMPYGFNNGPQTQDTSPSPQAETLARHKYVAPPTPQTTYVRPDGTTSPPPPSPYIPVPAGVRPNVPALPTTLPLGFNNGPQSVADNSPSPQAETVARHNYAAPVASNSTGAKANGNDGWASVLAPTPAPSPARSGAPSNPTHGQTMLGPDGNTYQYVQLTGGNYGAAANGTPAKWGWEQVGAASAYPGDLSRGGVSLPPLGNVNIPPSPVYPQIKTVPSPPSPPYSSTALPNLTPPSVPLPRPTPTAPATMPSFMPAGSSWATPYNSVPPAAPPTPPVTQTVKVTNPAYAAWQAQYGNQGGLATGTSQNTVSAKFNDSDGWASPVAPPVIPPAPPKFVTKTIPASIGAVPPVPMANPSWLAPVMPQSSVILPNFVTQAIGATKPGLLDLARFLSGSQNNGSYVTPQNGMSQLDTHYALLAQQGHQSPVATSAPSSGSYLQGALASAAKGNNNAIDYYNKVNG